METGNLADPDKIAEEKRRAQKIKAEDRIAEIEVWLLANKTSHPEWQNHVRERNSLYIKLAQIDKEKPVYGFEATPYRLAVNTK